MPGNCTAKTRLRRKGTAWTGICVDSMGKDMICKRSGRALIGQGKALRSCGREMIQDAPDLQRMQRTSKES